MTEERAALVISGKQLVPKRLGLQLFISTGVAHFLCVDGPSSLPIHKSFHRLFGVFFALEKGLELVLKDQV